MTLFNCCRVQIFKLEATTIDFLKFTIIKFTASVFGINLAHFMTISVDDLWSTPQEFVSSGVSYPHSSFQFNSQLCLRESFYSGSGLEAHLQSKAQCGLFRRVLIGERIFLSRWWSRVWTDAVSKHDFACFVFWSTFNCTVIIQLRMGQLAVSWFLKEFQSALKIQFALLTLI